MNEKYTANEIATDQSKNHLTRLVVDLNVHDVVDVGLNDCPIQAGVFVSPLDLHSFPVRPAGRGEEEIVKS